MALASFYCGRVLQEQGKNKAAMAEYMKADEYAENTTNINLRGLSQSLIGEIYLKEYLPAEAIEHFKIASQYFHKVQNIKNEIISEELIGQAYLTDLQTDSALFYYNKSRQLAISAKDYLQLANVLHDIGNAYVLSGKHNQALEYLRESISYGNGFMSENNKAKLYLNYARALYQSGQMDSAQFYMDRSFILGHKADDINTLNSIYKTLSEMEENKGNLHLSLDYQKKRAEAVASIVNKNKNTEILECQKKYERERLYNEKNKLEIKIQQILLFSSVALLVICLIALSFYRKSVQKSRQMMKKEHELLEKENELLEAKSKVYQLLEMAKSYDEKDNNMRNIVFHDFGILRKAATLESYVREDNLQDSRLLRIFNKIVYGEEKLNWETLYNTVNKRYNDLFEHIRKAYPSLNESEFQICCLTCMDFSCSEIGIFVGLSTNTVHAKRSLIRRKLGIKPQADIQEFLIGKFQ